MKGRCAVLAALGIVALADAPLAAQFRGPGRGGPPGGAYGWLGSLAAGKAQARSTGKPLMVVLRCVP